MNARLLIASLIVLCACKPDGPQKPDASESPQAAAEPAVLVAGTLNQGGFAGGGGLRPKAAMRVDQAPPREPSWTESREAPRTIRGSDAGAVRQGLSFIAHLRVEDTAPPSREANATAIETSRKRLDLRLDGFAESAHLRITLGSPGFLYRWGTELRARADLLGAIVVTPVEEDATSPFRVVPHGALRAVLGERRFDVAPLSNAVVKETSEGSKRFSQRTRRVDVAARAGRATIDLLHIHDLGEGGALLCFMLLDLLAALPNEIVCKVDEIPAYAEIRWTSRGGLLFEIDTIERRAEQSIEVPPSRSRFEPGAPTPIASSLLLTRVELAALHTVAIDVPPQSSDAAALPAEGLHVINNSDELRVLFIEGVPVAWLQAGAHLVIPALLRGRYVVEWRTFLGEGRSEPKSIVVPGVLESELKAP